MKCLEQELGRGIEAKGRLLEQEIGVYCGLNNGSFEQFLTQLGYTEQKKMVLPGVEIYINKKKVLIHPNRDDTTNLSLTQEGINTLLGTMKGDYKRVRGKTPANIHSLPEIHRVLLEGDPFVGLNSNRAVVRFSAEILALELSKSALEYISQEMDNDQTRQDL